MKAVIVTGILTIACAIVVKLKNDEWKKENNPLRTLFALLTIMFVLMNVCTQLYMWFK